jgi:hypothetical protein
MSFKNIKDITEIKVGQMIKIIVNATFEDEKRMLKGMVFKCDDYTLLIIPAYLEGNTINNGITRIQIKNIQEISAIRFSKVISDQLKKMYKNIQIYYKLKQQSEDINKQISIVYKDINATSESVTKEYLSTSNDISEDVLFDTMIKEINEMFDNNNEDNEDNNKPYVSINRKKNNLKHYVFKIEFSRNTGRGIFSKDDYDSRTEFKASDKDKLYEYCYKLKPSNFISSHWTSFIDKTIALGDKGSLETMTYVTVTLNKNKNNQDYVKINKDYILELKADIIKSIKSSL